MAENERLSIQKYKSLCLSPHHPLSLRARRGRAKQSPTSFRTHLKHLALLQQIRMLYTGGQMQEMIAYCGLVCSGCPAYVATQEDSDTLRKQVVEKWSSDQYPMKVEDITEMGN